MSMPSEMPTVCLLGSPRRGGNSDLLAQKFMEQASNFGAPTETYALADLNYNGCRNLFRCKTDLDHCGQVDDLTAVLDSITRAQVLVLASPVYFTSVTGQMKQAIDRFFSFFVPDYPTAAVKSRLSTGRHLVFVQTQGEPEDRYADLLDSFAVSFKALGFDHQHLVRAHGVRNPGDIPPTAPVMSKCDALTSLIYTHS